MYYNWSVIIIINKYTQPQYRRNVFVVHTVPVEYSTPYSAKLYCMDYSSSGFLPRTVRYDKYRIGLYPPGMPPGTVPPYGLRINFSDVNFFLHYCSQFLSF
jgi:hypothetical protein